MRNFAPLAAVAALVLSGVAFGQEFQEGQHFEAIGNPVNTPDDRVVVTDGFAYPCPACRRFMPYLSSWEDDLPDHVEVEHLPVALQPGWDLFARAYYTASVMGIAEETHEAMFEALHDEQRQFRSFEDIAEFYAEHGVEAESFLNTAESFAVDARMRQNRNDVRSMGIRGTPAMIVQGKWRVSLNGFSSYDEMLAAVDYLVERETEALELESGEEAADEQGEGESANEQAEDLN